MTKLIACVMAGNCEQTIEVCLKALEPQVDKVIICYDNSSILDPYYDESMHIMKDRGYDDDWQTMPEDLDIKESKRVIIYRMYEHDLSVKNANSDQRNFYLDYLKKHHLGDWVLCLDADEVVDENFSKFRECIPRLEKEGITILSPKMEHFIGDLAHVDATRESHHVLHRLFKVTADLVYPDGEHPVLQSKKNVMSAELDLFVIYHLAYCKEMFYIKDRYLTHKSKSEIHSQDFLQDWTYKHYTGSYPQKAFDITKMPKVLKEHFLIDDDYFYFKDRNIEMKQIIDAAQWRDYFKPNKVLLVGDGKAIRTLACRVAGMDANGFDISPYAVKHNLGGFPESIFWEEDIICSPIIVTDSYELVVAYDVLEHIDEKDLDKALSNLFDYTSKYLLVSVPMIGDPNLYNDNTHKIFWTRIQWEDKIKQAGFKIINTPSYFQYGHQLIIGEKVEQ